jgi:hypothetical protein
VEQSRLKTSWDASVLDVAVFCSAPKSLPEFIWLLAFFELKLDIGTLTELLKQLSAKNGFSFIGTKAKPEVDMLATCSNDQEGVATVQVGTETLRLLDGSG